MSMQTPQYEISKMEDSSIHHAPDEQFRHIAGSKTNQCGSTCIERSAEQHGGA